MEPSELVVLGDSLIELSDMAGFLAERARADGALGPDQSFRDQSSALHSFLADNAFSIVGQYRDAAQQGRVRTVVMNGGATDMMQVGCADPPNADCPLVVSALAGARTVLGRMANDGVEAVVYCFYADPVGNPGLTARLDLLRPLLEAACVESGVPCHFLDLRPVFAGHYADYVGPDGIVWSEPGARATAEAVWTTMQDACIAR